MEGQRPKDRKRKLLIVGAVVAAIIFVSILALIQNGDDPSDEGNSDANDNGARGRYGTIVEGNPTIMDIGSTSCVPCQLLEPVLESLGEKYDGEINIRFYDSWNTAEGAEMATRFKVAVIPTIIFLDGNGIEVARLVGYYPQDVIEDKMHDLGWI